MNMAALPAGARVLDVGCGPGATVGFLAGQGLWAVGIDASSKLLRQANGRLPQHPFSQALGQALPFAANQFDGLLAECCLSLLGDPVQALAEFARVLRPGGTLILSDMLAGISAGVAATRRPAVSCCIEGAFSRDQIEGLLAENGFSVSFWEDQSEALKRLAAQIIWEYGSLADFWHCAGAENTGIGAAVAELKPGYFLLLATKG
jgi:SAM-dependent methyltransferase